MKRILLAILVLNLAAMIYGQLITGVVMDEQTGNPVGFASVFFDGTFVGTTADEQGRFELDVTPYKSRSLIISAVGYYSNLITDFTRGESYQLVLAPRVFEIKEVSVTAKSLARKRKVCMQIFKKEFIGLTSNARRCYILNESDISFNYNSDKDTLKAFASKPIQIQNLALGYEITYHLERFEYERKTKTVLYTGSIIFNRDLLADEKNLKKYIRRREYSYTGSSKHFFRALWSNSLTSSGFSVSSYRTGEQLNFELLVLQDSIGGKFLQYSEDLKIEYYKQLSYISFLEEKVYFEQDGFFDPTSIMWSGKMSDQRIADFLPYEYSYEFTRPD